LIDCEYAKAFDCSVTSTQGSERCFLLAECPKRYHEEGIHDGVQYRRCTFGSSPCRKGGDFEAVFLERKIVLTVRVDGPRQGRLQCGHSGELMQYLQRTLSSYRCILSSLPLRNHYVSSILNVSSSPLSQRNFLFKCISHYWKRRLPKERGLLQDPRWTADVSLCTNVYICKDSCIWIGIYREA
jgi:hypothetical protein